MALKEKINEAAREFFEKRDELFEVNDFSREVIAEESFKAGANFILNELKLDCESNITKHPLYKKVEVLEAKLKIAVDALIDIKSEVGTSMLAAKFVNDALVEVDRVGVEK